MYTSSKNEDIRLKKVAEERDNSPYHYESNADKRDIKKQIKSEMAPVMSEIREVMKGEKQAENGTPLAQFNFCRELYPDVVTIEAKAEFVNAKLDDCSGELDINYRIAYYDECGICILKKQKSIQRISIKKEDDKWEIVDFFEFEYDRKEFQRIHTMLEHDKNIVWDRIVSNEGEGCISSAEGIEYSQLLSEENERLFVYFKDSDVIGSYYMKGDFLERKAFDEIAIGKTRRSEIEEIDKYCIFGSESQEDMSGHIVKEGIIVITYDGDTDSSLVTSIEFYDNSEVLDMMREDEFISTIPYILPSDKY